MSGLLVIVGPTASGKTELAVRLAEKLGGEIVSADSVQVYRQFDLGTGKPSAEERRRATHHLIDVVDPGEALDAARWAELAGAVIDDLRRRQRVPIVCGGTFLWIRALLFGLAPAPPADAEIRRRHQAVAESAGRAELHRQLAEVDPEAAARLAPNDFVRVSRALEVFEQSGIPLSRWQAEHGFRTPRYDARLFGVAREPGELDARILARTRLMLDSGWIEEVRQLIVRGHAGTRAMGSVGYRQIAEALARNGANGRNELELAIYRATRIFARRQRTWLRDQSVNWLDAERIRTLDLAMSA